MIKSLEEYNQSPHDYAHCAGTHHERASQCLYYNLHEAWYEYKKYYLLFTVNLLSTTLSLKTLWCHF